MNLPRDLHKAAHRIQMLAGFVLRHRFDHGVGQTFTAEIIQRVPDEPASQTLAAELRRDGEVWNPALLLSRSTRVLTQTTRKPPN